MLEVLEPTLIALLLIGMLARTVVVRAGVLEMLEWVAELVNLPVAGKPGTTLAVEMGLPPLAGSAVTLLFAPTTDQGPDTVV